jgi:hypothetical protein
MNRVGNGKLESVPPADLRSEINFVVPGTDDSINIVVFLYESLDKVEAAYALIREAQGATGEFGEQAWTKNIAIIDEEAVYISEVGFTRCHALVVMSMITLYWSDATILPAYAEKLDARLAELVCR